MITITHRENAEDLDSAVIHQGTVETAAALLDLVERLQQYPFWKMRIEKILDRKLVISSENMDLAAPFRRYTIVYAGEDAAKLGLVAAWFTRFWGEPVCSDEIRGALELTRQEIALREGEEVFPDFYKRPRGA